MIDDKSYIIDPLTCLCKIALLHYMPDGTKLAISHHILHIQEYTYSQWLERMKNGDSRRDISNLNTPLLKAIKWYIIENSEKVEMNKELQSSMETIAQYATKGLVKLQNRTYHTDKGIKIILQYFINLFRDAFSNDWNDNATVKADSDSSILTEKIKNNFDANTINSFAKMLRDAEKMGKSPEDINALIDCSHKLLINRDSVFVKLMKDVNTTL